MSKKLEKGSKYERFDVDGDDVLSTSEVDQGLAQISLEKAQLDLEMADEKSDSQRSMAWTCLVGVMVVTILLISPAVAETRVNQLSDLIGLFYISMAGVIGAHMGVTGWMNKK